MALKTGDFVKINFTGKLKDGKIFDSNIEKDLKTLNPNFTKEQVRPHVLCLGESMFLKGVEDFLLGKDIGKYELDLTPDKAFGKRDTKMIHKVPIKVFHDQKVNPVPRATFNFDGKIGKILTASGGRVLVDFNNPLAGKDVHYHIEVLGVVDKLEEKVEALNEFLFRKKLKFKIKEKTLILELDKQFSQFALLFKDKYKKMVGLDLEIKEVVANPKEEKKNEVNQPPEEKK